MCKLEGRDVVKDIVASPIVVVVGVAGGKLIEAQAVQLVPHHDQAVGVLIGQGPQKSGVNQAEDRRVGANAEGQGKDGDGCKSRVAAQLAQAKANVGSEFLEETRAPTVAAFFFYLADIAESSKRRVAGFLRAHASGDVLRDLFFKMKAQLIVHFLLSVIIAKQCTQVEHQS